MRISLAAVLPIVRVAMQVLHRPNDDDVFFDCVVNAVWKTADEIPPYVVFDLTPNFRAIENGPDAGFNLINKGVTQAGNLLVVIPAAMNSSNASSTKRCFITAPRRGPS